MTDLEVIVFSFGLAVVALLLPPVERVGTVESKVLERYFSEGGYGFGDSFRNVVRR